MMQLVPPFQWKEHFLMVSVACYQLQEKHDISLVINTRRSYDRRQHLLLLMYYHQLNNYHSYLLLSCQKETCILMKMNNIFKVMSFLYCIVLYWFLPFLKHKSFFKFITHSFYHATNIFNLSHKLSNRVGKINCTIPIFKIHLLLWT